MRSVSTLHRVSSLVVLGTLGCVELQYSTPRDASPDTITDRGADASDLGITDRPATPDAPSDAATLRDASADLPDVTCSRTLVNCGGTCVAVCATPSPAPTQLSCAAPGTPGCGMAAIAGGTFDMGGDTMAANSTPGQPMMSVSGLYLDRYEVTVARFRQFWNAVSASAPLRGAAFYLTGTATTGVSINYDTGTTGEPSPNSVNRLCNWSPTPGTGTGSLEAHPINCVTWHAAMAFCVWDSGDMSGRLPTETEWEWVARGVTLPGLATGRIYPWGDAGTGCSLANSLGCASGTLPVNVSPREAYGLFDLLGNVYEWTADYYQPFNSGSYWNEMPRINPLDITSGITEGRVTRGGGWQQAVLRSASRNSTPPYGAIPDGGVAPFHGYASVGFRCARNRP
jgi:formylglycine-generating enzyme